MKLVRLWNNAQTAGKFHSSRLLGRRGSIRERVRLERLVKRERATAHSEPNARTAGASYRISLYCAFAVSQRHVTSGCRRYYRRAFSVLIIFRGIIETGLPGWPFNDRRTRCAWTQPGTRRPPCPRSRSYERYESIPCAGKNWDGRRLVSRSVEVVTRSGEGEGGRVERGRGWRRNRSPRIQFFPSTTTTTTTSHVYGIGRNTCRRVYALLVDYAIL